MPARLESSCSHGAGSTPISSACLAVNPPRSRIPFTAASAITSRTSSSNAKPSRRCAAASSACSNLRFAAAFTCGALPPWTRQTFAPRAAIARHGSPFRLRAVHLTAGTAFLGRPAYRSASCSSSSSLAWSNISAFVYVFTSNLLIPLRVRGGRRVRLWGNRTRSLKARNGMGSFRSPPPDRLGGATRSRSGNGFEIGRYQVFSRRSRFNPFLTRSASERVP